MLALGIPIALLLTGSIWHYIGVADAVLQSQSVRKDADQTAFECAVWHARGMNVLASMNLLMLSLATVNAATQATYHWSEKVNLACQDDDKCWDKDGAQRMSDKLEDAIPKVFAWLDAQLTRVSELERVTVTATPAIAYNQIQPSLKPPPNSVVQYAFPFAVSFVPDTKTSTLLGAAPGRRMNTAESQPGLPVAPTQEAAFCTSQAKVVKDITDKLIDKLTVEQVVKFMPIGKHLEEQLAKVGFVQKTFWPEFNKNNTRCLNGRDMAGIWGPGTTAGSKAPDFVFQVYAFSFGTTGLLPNDDANVVRLTGEPGASTTPPNVWTASRAEYSASSCAGKAWSSCASTALLAPAWTVRLSRIRPAPGGKPSILGLSMFGPSGVPGSAQKALSGDVWTRIGELVH
jgi:hypothetical protein